MSSARHMYKNITCRALESQHIQWTIPHVSMGEVKVVKTLLIYWESFQTDTEDKLFRTNGFTVKYDNFRHQ